MANLTLLLADDSVTVQKVVNLTFAGEGIDVITVGDGNSAMDVLRENPPDLVMADVNMPGLNGYEICEKVRSMDSGKRIPVILLVGSFEPFDEDEARRVGADAHLTKPFESIGALVEKVQGFLGAAEGPERQRFDETVEYPPGSEMVVKDGRIPFAEGLEDDTIEAEQVRYGEPESRSVEQTEAPAQEPEEAHPEFGTFAPEQVDEQPAQSEPYEAVDHQPVFRAEPEQEAPSTEFADSFEPVEEGVPEERQETEEFTVADTEPERAAEAEYSEDFYYREESYFQSRSYSESAPEEEPEASPEVDFHPGPVTVELDEADLLELPVDRTFPDQETETAAQAADAGGSTVAQHPSEGVSEEPPRVSEEAGPESPGYFERQTESDFAQEAEPEPEYHPEPRDEVGTETDAVYEPESVRESRSYEPAALRSEPEAPEISDELLDEIARRVVERLSDRAVREIAWEVVPEMAEIIIRKMTEQKLNE